MLEQNMNQTSSIGACWPPEPASHQRLRGFYDHALYSGADVEQFTEQFELHARSAQEQGLTRTTIRAVVDAPMIRRIHDAGVRVEAAMPIAGHDGRWVAYMARNDEDRSMGVDAVAGHEERLAMRPVSRQREDWVRSGRGLWLPEGIVHSRTSPAAREQLVPRFTELYEAFGYTEDDVAELVTSPNNTIAYLEHEDQIVSTAMAEVGRVMVKGFGVLTMAEITEGITREDFRRTGLYRRVTAALVRRIVGVGPAAVGGLHVLFGECNLNMPGVLLAARENGREFSRDRTDRGRRLGLPVDPKFGMLEQNFRVEDGVETRPYNDFALSWIPLPRTGRLMTVVVQPGAHSRVTPARRRYAGRRSRP
jgi:hypothetical protein